MFLWNAVEFTHVALFPIAKVLDPVDIICLVCKHPGVIDTASA